MGLVEINLRGPIDFTRLILPSMIKRNSDLHIIFAGIIRIPNCFDSRLELMISHILPLTTSPRLVSSDSWAPCKSN